MGFIQIANYGLPILTMPYLVRTLGIANYGLLMFELRATMAAREYKLQALSALAALKAKEDDAEVAARITVAVKAITHHDKDAQEAARGFNLT